jgi:hypothetical protein
MGRPKKGNTKQISAKIPDYLYNIILKNQEENEFNNFTESLVNILNNGVNFKYFIDKENEDEK